jgi:hypothetical protein
MEGSMSEEQSDRLFVTFTAEEIGRIVVAIIKGVERYEAIRAMPRYSPEQYEAYAAFYDQLKEGIEITWQEA